MSMGRGLGCDGGRKKGCGKGHGSGAGVPACLNKALTLDGPRLERGVTG